MRRTLVLVAAYAYHASFVITALKMEEPTATIDEILTQAGFGKFQVLVTGLILFQATAIGMVVCAVALVYGGLRQE